MYSEAFRYGDDSNKQTDFHDMGFEYAVEVVESFMVSGLQKQIKSPK